MFYSLAKHGEDFFKYTLDRFIALGPCLINSVGDMPVEAVQGWYEASMAAGVYTINGPNAKEDTRKICELGGHDSSLCLQYKEMSASNGKQTQTIQNEYYWYQNCYEQKLQEW